MTHSGETVQVSFPVILVQSGMVPRQKGGLAN